MGTENQKNTHTSSWQLYCFTASVAWHLCQSSLSGLLLWTSVCSLWICLVVFELKRILFHQGPSVHSWRSCRAVKDLKSSRPQAHPSIHPSIHPYHHITLQYIYIYITLHILHCLITCKQLIYIHQKRVLPESIESSGFTLVAVCPHTPAETHIGRLWSFSRAAKCFPTLPLSLYPQLSVFACYATWPFPETEPSPVRSSSSLSLSLSENLYFLDSSS